MPRGILNQDPSKPLFLLNYEGLERPIGRVFASGPIGNPEHYIIKWDPQNRNDISDVDIAHSYEEALQKAHDFALPDLAAQTIGCSLEDRTSFAKKGLEQTTQPLPEFSEGISRPCVGNRL